jgi:hypothetical protein
MRRVSAIAGLVLLGVVACGNVGPPPAPTAEELAHRLERAGLCLDPHLNHHRRREVLCASRSAGGRTGVATFPSHAAALRSVDLERRAAVAIGCGIHASGGSISFVVGRRFVVAGSDRPAAAPPTLAATVVEPPATCRTVSVPPAE